MGCRAIPHRRSGRGRREGEVVVEREKREVEVVVDIVDGVDNAGDADVEIVEEGEERSDGAGREQPPQSWFGTHGHQLDKNIII